MRLSRLETDSSGRRKMRGLAIFRDSRGAHKEELHEKKHCPPSKCRKDAKRQQICGKKEFPEL